MRRRMGGWAALGLLLLVLSGCGGGQATAQLVTPPPNTAATAVVLATQSTATRVAPVGTATAIVALPPAPTASAVVTARPTLAPTVATSATVVPTVPHTVAATRAPTMAATKTPLPATVTKPPAPTATRVPATVAPVAKARVVERGPATRRLIALTFDAGADRGYAARILDTLRDSGVKATFGMTGKWAEQHPDLVQRMVAEGHQLMNHTYDHASFTGYSPGTAPLTADERRREIERTEAVIGAIAGVKLKPYFRPPYGDYDQAMLSQLGQLGYTQSVMWTVDSLGWNGRTAEQIVKRCVDGAVPGAILLFHVGAASQDVAALPELLRQLKGAGYGFATIAELLR